VDRIVIIVTGTPGTGKTELSKRISDELGLEYVDVNDLISKKHLSENFDSDRRSWVVDEKKLSLEIEKIISSSRRGLIIDSHLSHYVSPTEVDLCIVTKCELKELRFRLERRGYAEKKVKENMDCEVFDICLNEAVESGHRTMVVDTTSLDLKKKKVLSGIIRCIESHFPGKSFK
jgi:adenylate kinase